MLYTRLSGINFEDATETFKANWLVRAWGILGTDERPPVETEVLRTKLEQAQDTLSIKLSVSTQSLFLAAEWLEIRKEIEQLSLETRWHIIRWDVETQKYLPRVFTSVKTERFAVMDTLEEIGYYYHLQKLTKLAYSIHIYENPRLIAVMDRSLVLTNISHFVRYGVVPQVHLNQPTHVLKQELEKTIDELKTKKLNRSN